jgi:hypothetical protein
MNPFSQRGGLAATQAVCGMPVTGVLPAHDKSSKTRIYDE